MECFCKRVSTKSLKCIDMGGDGTHCCQVINVKLLALLLLLVLLTGRIAPLTDTAFRSVGRLDRSAVSN